MTRYHIIASYFDGRETPVETVEADSHAAALAPYPTPDPDAQFVSIQYFALTDAELEAAHRQAHEEPKELSKCW